MKHKRKTRVYHRETDRDRERGNVKKRLIMRDR